MGRDGPAGDAHLPFAHIPAWHKCRRRVVTLLCRLMPSSAAAVAVSGGGANAADELEDRPLEEGGELEGNKPAATASPCRARVGSAHNG